jgi:hypothetical protein
MTCVRCAGIVEGTEAFIVAMKRQRRGCGERAPANMCRLADVIYVNGSARLGDVSGNSRDDLPERRFGPAWAAGTSADRRLPAQLPAGTRPRHRSPYT